MFFFHMDKPQETSGFYMCARLLASAPALEQFKRRPISTGKDWDSRRHHHHHLVVVVVVDQSRRGCGASKAGSAAGSHHGRPPQAAQCLARLADGAPTDFQMALVGAAAYAEDRWDMAWLMGFKWGFEWIPKKVDVTGSIWKP